MLLSFSGPAYRKKNWRQGQALWAAPQATPVLTPVLLPDSKSPLRGKRQSETNTALVGIRSVQALATNNIAAPKMERIPNKKGSPISLRANSAFGDPIFELLNRHV